MVYASVLHVLDVYSVQFFLLLEAHEQDVRTCKKYQDRHDKHSENCHFRFKHAIGSIYRPSSDSHTAIPLLILTHCPATCRTVFLSITQPGPAAFPLPFRFMASWIASILAPSDTCTKSHVRHKTMYRRLDILAWRSRQQKSRGLGTTSLYAAGHVYDQLR